MKNGKAMGPDELSAEIWKSLGEEGQKGYVVGSVAEDIRAGENARGMEGQCDCTNLQREGENPVLWE